MRLPVRAHVAFCISTLLAAGCSSTAVPTGTTAEPPALTPAQPLRPAYGLATAPEPLGVIVRYKPGRGDVAALSGQRQRMMQLSDTRVLATAEVAERDALVAKLNANPDVEYAEVDQRLWAFTSVNDPQLPAQWAIPKINMPSAWDLGQGAGVTVAVVDTGADFKHEDLQGQLIAGPALRDAHQGSP